MLNFVKVDFETFASRLVKLIGDIIFFLNIYKYVSGVVVVRFVDQPELIEKKNQPVWIKLIYFYKEVKSLGICQ